MTGLIFDIQGFSVHDGGGCRTLVFLCGCPLRCAWCSNPEGQLLRPRLMYRVGQCLHTHYRCVPACPCGAIRIERDTDLPLRFDRSLCDRCEGFECVSACLNQALRVAGRPYAVDELVRILVRDQGFWGSQGGVTFGGGEPLAQPEFLLAVLSKCRDSYIHTAVETCAHADTDLLLKVLRGTDWLFLDLKHMDAEAHRAGTGMGNDLILRNIAAVASASSESRLVLRVPIVPGFNDSVDNLRATAVFMLRHNLKEVNLLPFHRMAQSKYEQLGLDWGSYGHVSSPSEAAMRAHQQVFEAEGLHCYVGSDTPF